MTEANTHPPYIWRDPNDNRYPRDWRPGGPAWPRDWRERIVDPTPAEIYLGSETSGLAIDFAQNSALVRDPADILSFSGAPVDLLTYTSPSPKMVYGADGVLRYTDGVEMPLDHDPVTLEAKGVLIEEQRTNAALNSGNWTAATYAIPGSGVTRTANYGTAPNGIPNSTTRVQLAAGGTSGDRYIQQPVGASVASQTHTVSYWVRSLTGGDQIFRMKATHSNVSDYFSPDKTATPVWQRFSFSQLFGATAGTGITAGLVVGTGNAPVDVEVWGMQIELNAAFPTSYIPTTSARVTRAADQFGKPTSAFPYNAAEGTFVAEGVTTTFLGSAAVRDIVKVWDGTGQNRIRLYSYPNRGGLNITYNNTTVADLTSGGEALVTGEPFNIAGAYKVDDCAKIVGGSSLVTDTSMPSLPTVSIFEIGAAGAVSNLNGHMKRLKYLPRRATNTELQEFAA